MGADNRLLWRWRKALRLSSWQRVLTRPIDSGVVDLLFLLPFPVYDVGHVVLILSQKGESENNWAPQRQNEKKIQSNNDTALTNDGQTLPHNSWWKMHPSGMQGDYVTESHCQRFKRGVRKKKVSPVSRSSWKNVKNMALRILSFKIVDYTDRHA